MVHHQKKKSLKNKLKNKTGEICREIMWLCFKIFLSEENSVCFIVIIFLIKHVSFKLSFLPWWHDLLVQALWVFTQLVRFFTQCRTEMIVCCIMILRGQLVYPCVVRDNHFNWGEKLTCTLILIYSEKAGLFNFEWRVT